MIPAISIITVTRNNAEGLRRTIDSVAALEAAGQVELIVIDGHSTDDTDALVEARRDFVAVYEKDAGEGIYGAMNQGIERAVGEWLIFMNAGDCFASADVIDQVCSELEGDLVFGKARKTTGEEQLPFLGYDLAWKRMPFSHQAVFIKASLMRERPYDLSFPIAADFDFVLWALSQKRRCQRLDTLIAEVDVGGVSETRVMKRVLETYRVARRYYSHRAMHWHYLMKLRWAMNVSLGRIFRDER